MRRKLSAALTLSALAFNLAATVPQAQNPRPSDQKIIDDFINSRGVDYGEPPARPKPRPRRRPPAPGAPRVQKSPATGAKPKAAERVEEAKPTPHAPAQEATKRGAGDAKPAIQPATARAIALAYSVALKGADDKAIVVDESREFKLGDSIRVLLETNTNGYLYIFQTEEGSKTQMLYPHAALDNGWNGIAAHTRDSVPAGDWFEFVPPAGAFRVYVILSRPPLEGVPVGEELIEFCGGRRDDCLWQPEDAEWERIKAASSTDAKEIRTPQPSGTQIPLADEALTRGLRLKKGAPAPAVLRVAPSPAADALMTVITLVSK